MMQHPPPDGRMIDAEEHAERLSAYHARIKLALERYAEWKRRKETTK